MLTPRWCAFLSITSNEARRDGGSESRGGGGGGGGGRCIWVQSIQSAHHVYPICMLWHASCNNSAGRPGVNYPQENGPVMPSARSKGTESGPFANANMLLSLPGNSLVRSASVHSTGASVFANMLLSLPGEQPG